MKLTHTFGPTYAFAIGVTLFAAALSFGPQRQLIEQSMVWHMVIQMPLLVLSGWMWASALSRSRQNSWVSQWDRYGLTGSVGVLVIVTYWMLPTTIDRAIVLVEIDILKLVTLLIGGAILRESSRRAPQAVQLFFVGVTVSMMAWLGLYFMTTNLRLCNVYSQQTQVDAGLGLLTLGAAIGTAWLWVAIGPTYQLPSKSESS